MEEKYNRSPAIREGEDRLIPVKGMFDVPFLLITCALVLFGCVMIYSASSVFAEKQHGDNTYYIARHLVFLLMSVAFTAVVVRFCTPLFWRDFSYILFGVAVVLLLLVPFIGEDLNSGAKRWLDFKIFTIQPSEIAKMALVLTMARFMSTHENKIMSPHRFGGNFKYGVLYPGMMIMLIAGLIAVEKHISGLMIICMLGVAIMFMGGTRMKWLLGLGGIVVLAG